MRASRETANPHRNTTGFDEASFDGAGFDETTTNEDFHMGKGDRKTAKGKRYNSSYGNVRLQVSNKATGAASAPVVKKAAAKPAVAKKAVAKKAAAK